MPPIPIVFQVASLTAVTAILLVDLFIISRRARHPSIKESTAWVSVYIGLALAFASLMFAFAGGESAGQFLAGWLTEYSLSIDNLFVFIIIMTRFAVPKTNQQAVLMVGIILALILRGIFILLGVRLLESYSWIFYLFGAWLVWTAIQQLREQSEIDDQRDSWLVRLLRRHVPTTDQYDGLRLRVEHGGTRRFTPMIIVLIAIGFTDLLFALDSIPAIFGITQSAFIVFTANVFALMGLRQLYFLLGDLLDRLHYLKYGIAFVLAFIGVKLVLHAMHANELPFINAGKPVSWAPQISTWTSLAVIVMAIAIAVTVSIVDARRLSRSGRTATG